MQVTPGGRQSQLYTESYELWEFFIHKRNAGITLTGSLKTSSQFPAEKKNETTTTTKKPGITEKENKENKPGKRMLM